MTSPKQLTLRRLLNTSFVDLYKKLVLGEELSQEESLDILSIAVILVSQSDVYLNKLGYRIVLFYGNSTGDYIPLYDISVNTGLMPVANILKRRYINQEISGFNSEFINDFTDSYLETFREGHITYTEQQLVLNSLFKENTQNSMYIVAPTSYGKSELIITSLKNNENLKFCILVPSKSLLAQTKKRILDAQINWIEKIVTHPEMHDPNLTNALYILTQERLSRLLSIDETLAFDFLFVDEAHNLLSNDSRNELLASVISIVNYRNSHIAIKYLTPFLQNTSNLELRNAESIDLKYLIKEYIKTERFYLADFRNGRSETLLYEQYVNQLFDTPRDSNNAISYIQECSANKNIVYFNKPKDIEKYVLELSEALEPINDEDVNIAIEELGNNMHQDYKLIECLKKGVVYHHGSMTDMVRNYVEYLFRKSPNLKYLVSSSTLLEGINLPIEKLFLMNYGKGLGNLTVSQFRNLVGRVSRFSDIFVEGNSDLKKLEPEIHIIASDGYMPQRANPKAFLEQRAYVIKKIKDDPKNVLLKNTPIDETNRKEFEDATSRLENMEQGIVDDYDSNYITTRVGKLLISNSVSEIDVFTNEEFIQDSLGNVEENSISDTNTLMKVIVESFITYSESNELSRLENLQAQTFYAMMLDWKIAKIPLKLMIRNFINYWDSLYERYPNKQVYVGRWGDETDATNENSFREHFTRINSKTRKEKINLAIVRIKEEEDFIEYKIFRFVDVLNDLNLIDSTFYKKLKYGTTDDVTINLIRNGLSRSVAELLLQSYRSSITIDNNNVKLNPDLPRLMRDQDESILKIFEVELNTGVGT